MVDKNLLTEQLTPAKVLKKHEDQRQDYSRNQSRLITAGIILFVSCIGPIHGHTTGNEDKRIEDENRREFNRRYITIYTGVHIGCRESQKEKGHTEQDQRQENIVRVEKQRSLFFLILGIVFLLCGQG